ncbi:zinc carboxypeptidase precursor [bacterium BMS3Abin03]|nr:zinc carboxypeptidase precursor [bacterium BMS3Abin03]HDZ58505.1 T9SS type A sorting domain-containing protein [Ignavibacteriales bacterium]
MINFTKNLILFILFLPVSLFSQQIDSNYFKENIEVYFTFELSGSITVGEITNIISIDNVADRKIFAYANEDEFEQFLRLDIPYKILPKPGTLISPKMSDDIRGITDWNVYPTYEAYVAKMNQFAIDYPDICELIDGGYTVQGRKILFAKISDNVSVREAEPQFLYTSTMHGDETTGYVLMLRLIDSLLTSYGTDPEITNLVNNVEIWINPLANPDGTYHSGNNTVYGATRYNANGYDLNRNFPDPEYGVNSNEQPETIIFKTIAGQNNFTLCANFHGGAEVVNYPWDTWSSGYPDYISHPDDLWYQFISHQYADTCQQYSPSNYMNGFDDGITNGGEWYVIHGGRQDYMNYFMYSREVTIELSDVKLLPANQLPALWDYNKRSFCNYIKNTLYGVKGLVTDTTNASVKALITVVNHDEMNSEIYSDSLTGNYIRMLSPGFYSITFSAPDFIPQTINNVVVSNFSTTILNVELVPENSVPVELISFDANVMNSNVMLNWFTATELNNRGFEIQRKANGDFVKIGFVPGHGTITEIQSYSFTDDNVIAGSYSYRLKQIDFDGTIDYSNVINVDVTRVNNYFLAQNYPNPFNPGTTISFAIAEDGKVTLRIFDILGNEIETLVNSKLTAGKYEVEFNGTDLPSGVYLYSLETDGHRFVKKMTLLR